MIEAPRVLVAEDDDLTRELLAKVLRREGYETVEVADGAEALARLGREPFDCIVSDVQMAGASGTEILEHVERATPDVPVVLITAYAEADAAMDAVAKGAADYLGKPVDVLALRTTVARALERRRLRREGLGGPAGGPARDVLVGTSPPMLELYKEIAHVAPTDATVLLLGESGSGKELVARTLHQRSRRAAGPFLAVNCASLAEGILESELFGHEKGAFTGAHAVRRGLFEEASGGTLFLDEVGDVPPRMQAQLLRVLEEGKVRRVGGSASIPIDVRVVSATHRDLAREVAEHRMREDLYYRLNVVQLRIPPLRDRGDDVVALARHLVALHASRLGRPVPDLSAETLDRIRAYRWPGNVRELENALARAVVLSQRSVLLPEDLPAAVAAETAGGGALDRNWPTLAELDRRYIERVLQRTGGNRTEAAALLGIDRRTLQRMLAREGKES